MTKNDLTKELKRVMPCVCLAPYKDRGMADPECSWCGYGEDIVDFILDDRNKIVAPLVMKIKELQDSIESMRRTNDIKEGFSWDRN